MIMNHGQFTDDIMIYERFPYNLSINSSISAFHQTSYDSFSRNCSNFTITKNYTTETYYYSIEKNNSKYLYVCPPLGEFYYNSSYIEVCNIKKNGIPIGIWIGAGAFVLVFYILIIIFYLYKKAPKQKHIDAAAFETIVINASPSTNASNQND